MVFSFHYARGFAREERVSVFGLGEDAKAGNQKPGGSIERRARQSILTEMLGRLIKCGQAK